MAAAENSFIVLPKASRSSTNSAAMKVPLGARECVLTLDSDQPAATRTLDAKLQWSTDRTLSGTLPAPAWWKDVTTAAFTQVTNAGGASQQILIPNGFPPGGYIRVLTTTVNGAVTFGIDIAFR